MTSDSAIRSAGIGRSLITGTMYFAAVFAGGFLLGIVRVLFIEPRTGTRWAELAEMPLMLAVIVVVARTIVVRTQLTTLAQTAGTGCVALGLLLAAEKTLVLLRGTTVADYLADRDPVSGTVYAVMLLTLAAVPTLVLLAGNVQPTRKTQA